ncbi:unnamed protein product [Lactuca saligna]|uniref:Uncharacterized protein n=1 Tax=Lactuca saligna TaxID=75948 RepID=A0AA35YQR3_LACSI|nr:unnamed protein product [Lactuca saligna]
MIFGLWWCFSAEGGREGDMEVAAVGNRENITGDSSSLTGEGDERDDNVDRSEWRPSTSRPMLTYDVPSEKSLVLS